ncbi:phage tail sheath subtilisin-like domain-containing protein [Clostridium sp. DJ247]|uniref:phage tail sheath subtilisin-like domain-containing protein n=1 Tax=Clostridium sp. DJ247 TaxID=2726188 RepID=UPI001627A216|nr:phage tail sheath subtilisin-like domain-containing protein [Clostridium sp. DJ247]MBC2579694.1 phage tail sheath protein [Clostridium sp. DJ247]
MGLPNINIIFKETGVSAIKRGERGIVALILKDDNNNGLITLNSINEMPTDLSNYNKSQISLAFTGYTKPPLKVIAYVLPTAAADYSEAQGSLETTKWDYLAIPGIAAVDTTNISIWIKSLRDTKNIKVKAVLPNTAADHEGIINFSTDDIMVGSTMYSSADYCSRIAGLLAGTPLNISATYAPLSEVTDVPHLSKSDFDSGIDAGKLMLIHDGEKVKIARAVNSLTTTTVDKNEDYKKIKIVDIMDQIFIDINKTVEDTYTGKCPNDYDHKCVLITALQAYFEMLEDQNLLDSGKSKIGIDIEAQSNFLKSKGIDVSKLKEQELKEANTGDKVFLGGTVKILDAMEDFNFEIGM